jgi:aspartate/methionine/tyrosine aminotransferase
MQLPPFLIERMFAKHEFTARVNLTGSDTEALTLNDLWQVAPAQTRAWYESLTLGYTESPGHPELRELAAQASDVESGSAVQIFAGATEAVFVLLNAVLEAGDHAIVIGPTYQLLIDVPRAIGADVTEVRLRRENAWQLDISEIKDALRPSTRLIVANFPHNPTGSLKARAPTKPAKVVDDRTDRISRWRVDEGAFEFATAPMTESMKLAMGESSPVKTRPSWRVCR